MTQVPADQARRIGVTVGLPVLAAAGILIAYFRWLPRLPDRIATHFGTGMRADGFTATGTYPFVMPSMTLGFGIVFGLLALAMRAKPDAQRIMCATAGGVAVLMFVINVLLLHMHLGVIDPTTLGLPGWHLAATVGGLGVGGCLGWLLAGKVPAVAVEPPAEIGEPVQQVPTDEPIIWRRTQRAPVVLAIMFNLLVVALVSCIAGSWWLLALWIPVFLLLAAFSRITVVVDDSGLEIRLLTGWPRIRVPVAEIRTAHSRDIDPLTDFGGWGWRSTPTAGGFVLRAGPGLWVYRRQQGPLAVTVPDADEAAALLNGLRDRYRETR